MTNPKVSYFFKKFYRNIIKWWFVIYNPVAKKIWPSKEEAEAAKALEEAQKPVAEPSTLPEAEAQIHPLDAFNPATQSFSGLYGKAPVDNSTLSVLDEILQKASSQSSIDQLVATTHLPEPEPAREIPPERESVIEEANAIYERLLREAAEDEARKQAEIENLKAQMEKESTLN